jgi:hypothetical protein
MIIYVDVNADPQQIARALRRELGSELCLQVGLELAERGRSRYRLLVVDGHEVREADHEHPDTISGIIIVMLKNSPGR